MVLKEKRVISVGTLKNYFAKDRDSTDDRGKAQEAENHFLHAQ